MAAPVLALNNPGKSLADHQPCRRQYESRAGAICHDTGYRCDQEYLRRQQETNDIPTADRVQVQTLEAPRRAQLFEGRSKTMPIIVFLALIAVTAALAFVLENVRPAARPVIAPADETTPAVRARRSA